ncbi:MAG: metal-dependent hydrolase [Firmicutes bacterium]|nr:metal-dependent hydrolase [Bacillota bacterium]
MVDRYILINKIFERWVIRLKNVIALPVEFEREQIKLTIFPTIIQDENNLILVDCGFPGFVGQIKEAMKQVGVSIQDLTKIIITHHDHDHIGALKEIVSLYPEVEVLCSEKQVPYITGQKKSLRLAQAEENHKVLNESERVANQKFMDMILAVQHVTKVTTVKDGELLPICGGVQIIDTSGHMPGHISVYIPSEKTLIAGDALGIQNGDLCIANPQFVLDMKMAVRSIEKISHLDVEKVICYHGGEYDKDVKAKFKQIINAPY